MTTNLDIRSISFRSKTAPRITIDNLIIVESGCKMEVEVVDHRIWGTAVLSVNGGAVTIESVNFESDQLRKEAEYVLEAFDLDVVYTAQGGCLRPH